MKKPDLSTRGPVPVAVLLLLPLLGGCGGEAPGETRAVNDLGQTGAPSGPVEISTPDAPEAIGPYSQAIQVGATLYLAGQLGLDPESGTLVAGGIEAETRQTLDNLGAVLEAAGFSFDDVVQSQVFLADLEEFAAMNEIYAGYFGDRPPARATVEVARLPRDARVEIMLTAVRHR